MKSLRTPTLLAAAPGDKSQGETHGPEEGPALLGAGVQKPHLQRVKAHPLDNCPQVKEHTTGGNTLIPAVSLHSHGSGLTLGPPLPAHGVLVLANRADSGNGAQMLSSACAHASPHGLSHLAEARPGQDTSL